MSFQYQIINHGRPNRCEPSNSAGFWKEREPQHLKSILEFIIFQAFSLKFKKNSEDKLWLGMSICLELAIRSNDPFLHGKKDSENKIGTKYLEQTKWVYIVYT